MLDDVVDRSKAGAHSSKFLQDDMLVGERNEDRVAFAGDGEYKAFGRPSTGMLPRFFVFFGKKGYGPGNKAVKQFQYLSLESDGGVSDGCGFGFSPTGQEFSIKLAGSRLWKLTVRGRNLWEIYDYLTLHRLPWIRVADRDFPDGGEAAKKPIILSADLEEITGTE